MESGFSDSGQDGERTRRSFNGLTEAGAAYAIAQWAKGKDLKRFAKGDSKPVKRTSSGSSALIVAADGRTAEELFSNLEFFLRGSGPSAPTVRYFPSWDILPFEELSPSIEILSDRLSVLDCLNTSENIFVVTSAEALCQKIPRPEILRSAVITLKRGELTNRELLISDLDLIGYRRTVLTERIGQFSVRGNILDVFPVGAVNPVRIELFGDSIESIREYAADSQRSIRELPNCRIIAAREHVAAWKLVERGFFKSRSSTETLAAAIERLRLAADNAPVPTRQQEAIEDLIATGADLPGLDQFLPMFQDPLASLWDYFPKNCELVTVDNLGITSALEKYWEIIQEKEERAHANGQLIPAVESLYTEPELIQRFLKEGEALSFNNLELIEFLEPSEFSANERKISTLDIAPNSDLLVALKGSKSQELPFKPLAEEINLRRSQGFEVAIAVSHPSKLRRFRELLESYDILAVPEEGSFAQWQQNSGFRVSALRAGAKPPVSLILGAVTGGLRVLADGVLLISDHEIFPDFSSRKNSRTAAQARRLISSISQLDEGDFVVHVDHGVAIYRGLKQIPIDGVLSDFLHLEYADEAKLFVPVENLGRVQKFVGADGRKPILNKLGGNHWRKTKDKIRVAVQELAGQLINLYAEREMVIGNSFGELNEDDRMFADTFPYVETPDQEKSIADVLGDMAKDKPMDRLVCGDVGYGKTEVALRAAFKAVNSGRQVAMLVPTTVLADQHFNTFNLRLGQFGVRVRCVSRFFTAAENKQTIAELSAGKVDLIIGTHRLLQKDVYFHDLGLVIIDEEHRFGVADKERLKKLRKEVDVLTLTATPIPRTLHMSLASIRDLSVIETPPSDRQVIRTYVGNYNPSTVREAILRELARGGQIFFIHNRVSTIAALAEELRMIVPEAKIEFAHGQMRHDELESVMHRFISRDFDLLLSTTIVESGLDIPNANTIIIKEADKFGLAELYQLRGRVGRSSRRAYAYLLVANAATLTGDAKKRLQVLQSLDDLGMGFRLALQDMEIRGAGNLLGRDQSGKIDLVGFELYTRILKEAVRELRARQREGTSTGDTLALETLIDPEIKIGFPSHIPPFYIPDVEERLLLYQRLVSLRDEKEASELTDEIIDRFGNPPKEVQMLMEIMIFKSVLRRAGIVSANRRENSLTLAFHKNANIDLVKLGELVQRHPTKLKITGEFSVRLQLASEEIGPHEMSEKVRALAELISSSG